MSHLSKCWGAILVRSSPAPLTLDQSITRCYEFAATNGFIFYNATRRANALSSAAQAGGTFVYQGQSLSLTVQDQLQDYTLLTSATNGDPRIPIFTDTSSDSYATTGDHTCRQIWRSLNPKKATATRGPFGYVVLDAEACSRIGLSDGVDGGYTPGYNWFPESKVCVEDSGLCGYKMFHLDALQRLPEYIAATAAAICLVFSFLASFGILALAYLEEQKLEQDIATWESVINADLAEVAS